MDKTLLRGICASFKCYGTNKTTLKHVNNVSAVLAKHCINIFFHIKTLRTICISLFSFWTLRALNLLIWTPKCHLSVNAYVKFLNTNSRRLNTCGRVRRPFSLVCNVQQCLPTVVIKTIKLRAPCNKIIRAIGGGFSLFSVHYVDINLLIAAHVCTKIALWNFKWKNNAIIISPHRPANCSAFPHCKSSVGLPVKCVMLRA